eukprot:6176225-Pleurochrysis_carterae.AAC.8
MGFSIHSGLPTRHELPSCTQYRLSSIVEFRAGITAAADYLAKRRRLAVCRLHGRPCSLMERENEGPISDLLSVDISVRDKLTQAKYIDTLVRTYLPDGVPTLFHLTHASTADTLPLLVDSALSTKQERPGHELPHQGAHDRGAARPHELVAMWACGTSPCNTMPSTASPTPIEPPGTPPPGTSCRPVGLKMSDFFISN